MRAAPLFALALALTLATATPSAQRRPVSPITVVAELVEAGPSMPHCGIVHFIVPMRYRVRSVTRGDVSVSQELFVAVSCPELSGARFTPGAQHALELTTRRPWQTGSLVAWPGHPVPGVVYWARRVHTAP